jgi:hypothetical protein
MKKQSTKRNLPHDGVWTRIQRSPIAGVGVFAIRAIPKGTFMFPDDNARIRWVDKKQIKGLRGELRRLYDDFSIIKDNGRIYGCPSSFNRLTVAWFMNEPKPGQAPNVGCAKDYAFYALRKIAAGKELTLDYNTFSERPPTSKSG